MAGSTGIPQWCFSQVKGTLEDEIHDEDIISCMEFDHDGELLATGDKSGRVVIFQRDPQSKTHKPPRGEYNVYSTFQSHTARFDSLKSLDIEAKINKIRWLKRKNAAHFLLSTNDSASVPAGASQPPRHPLSSVSQRPDLDPASRTAAMWAAHDHLQPFHEADVDGLSFQDKTVKLWKVSERDKREVGFNTREDSGAPRDYSSITSLKVPRWAPMRLTVNACPRRKFRNAHVYHINSISVNSDQETFLSADDLRINLWHLEVNDKSFNIVDIKPSNMEELTEVITAAEFHPAECNLFVYSSSKGTIRLCDMRQAALCDNHAKMFEGPEDPSRSFFSEIISSISDVKFSNSGRYMISRDYLSVNVWDMNMESRPIETYQVHDYLRTNLCSLYENDFIFDKFECCWNGNDSHIMTGSYNNFFRVFDRESKKEVTLEASPDIAKPKTILKPRKVSTQSRRKKDEIAVDCLDYNKKILHTAWHPHENTIAVAATNQLYIFHEKDF